MQTIEEYKAYTKQLEGEVGKWHHAYDALMVERNQLVNRIRVLETENKQLKGDDMYIKISKTDCQNIVNQNLRGGG